MLLPGLPAEQVVDRLVSAVVAPPGEVVVHRAAGRQVMRQVIPLATGPALVEDRVDDLPHRIAALVAADRGVRSLPPRDHRLDQGPPLTGEIARGGPARTHPSIPAQPR